MKIKHLVGFAVILLAAIAFIGCDQTTAAPTTYPALGGTLTITGSAGPRLGESLIADTSGITNGAGVPAYQWKRRGQAISGATASTYTVVAADGGATLTVTVTYSENTGSLTSEPTTAVPAAYTAPPDGAMSRVNGVSVESITFTPASPQPVGTSVTATVAFTGTATIAATFTVNLTSAKAGLDGAAESQNTGQGNTPTAVNFTFTVPSRNIDDFDLALSDLRIASLKEAFGITTTGVQGVTDTFNAIHTYLAGKTAEQLASGGNIQLGDYIDLEGGITVSGGAPNATVANTPLLGHGTLLRLVVVGINSFNASGDYTGNGNGEDAHLVFQFQNLPFTRAMEADATNANGYGGSDMRTYLTGAFLTGLYAAGVPDAVLWAPKRYAANKGTGASSAALIQDKLWLPTEREMFASQVYSNPAYETEENQARLEYYADESLRTKKYNAFNASDWYWLASPLSTSTANFCLVSYTGYSSNGPDDASLGGCVPAFCVK
jgi:hypothetical protein